MFAIVRPENPTEAILVLQKNLETWAYEELKKRGPITNPDFQPAWSLTNLIGEGYVIAEVVAS